jgi:hypothetical protein
MVIICCVGSSDFMGYHKCFHSNVVKGGEICACTTTQNSYYNLDLR